MDRMEWLLPKLVHPWLISAPAKSYAVSVWLTAMHMGPFCTIKEIQWRHRSIEMGTMEWKSTEVGSSMTALNTCQILCWECSTDSNENGCFLYNKGKPMEVQEYRMTWILPKLDHPWLTSAPAKPICKWNGEIGISVTSWGFLYKLWVAQGLEIEQSQRRSWGLSLPWRLRKGEIAVSGSADFHRFRNSLNHRRSEEQNECQYLEQISKAHRSRSGNNVTIWWTTSLGRWKPSTNHDPGSSIISWLPHPAINLTQIHKPLKSNLEVLRIMQIGHLA